MLAPSFSAIGAAAIDEIDLSPIPADFLPRFANGDECSIVGDDQRGDAVDRVPLGARNKDIHLFRFGGSDQRRHAAKEQAGTQQHRDSPVIDSDLSGDDCNPPVVRVANFNGRVDLGRGADCGM